MRRSGLSRVVHFVVGVGCVSAFSRVRAPASTRHDRWQRSTSAEEEDVETWWQPEEHDVVEYVDADDGAIGLGVVLKNGMIHPLCVFEEGGTEYVWDEEVPSVPGSLAVRIVDDVFPTTRQAQRGVDNPHGEHAEDVYEIQRDALDDNVRVAIRPEREIVW